MPETVEDVTGGGNVGLRGRQLEVAHLTIHSRWHLVLGKWHGELGKEGEAINLKVGGEADGADDGARTEIDKCACADVSVLQVEVYVALAPGDDAEAVVVDDEGRRLLNNQVEHTCVAMNDGQFAVEEDAVTNLVEVRGDDFPHLPQVHQFRLFAHRFLSLLVVIWQQR